METKLLGFLSCRYPHDQFDGLSSIKIPKHATLLHIHKRLLTFMIHKLALLLNTKNTQILGLFKQILEYLFCSLDSQSLPVEHLNLLELASMYFQSIENGSQYWIQLRSLYICALEKYKKNTEIKDEVTLRRASMNPTEFANIISNQQLDSPKLQQLKCYFSPFDVKISQTNIETFLFLYDKGLIPFTQITFTRDNFLYNQLKFKIIADKSEVDDMSLLKLVWQNPYNPDILQFSFLKHTKRTETYIKILIKKIEYTDDTVLWNQLYQLINNVEESIKTELVKHYYQYYLKAYLHRQIHKDCNPSEIMKYLNHRSQIMKKLSPSSDHNQITKIINYIKERV